MDKATISIEIRKIDQQIKELEKQKEKLKKDMHRLHEDDKVNNFLQRYGGQRLLKKHTLDEVGLWEVRGEDPNCDMGGHHHQPLLGYFEGKLEDVIKHAVHLSGFWQWGAGGDITKVEKQLITKV